MKPHLIFLVFVVVVLKACQSPEAEKKPIKPPASLVLRIWGEEGREFFHCLAQVQNLESNGIPGKLDPDESLSVDGVRLMADSARYSGIFYQADLPIDQFEGEHNISFTSEEGRTHSGNFEFSPFSLEMGTELTLTADEFDFQLLNFPPGENMVHLLITDTAYATDDINILIPVRDGRLVVSPRQVSLLKKGPVAMQIIFEKEKLLALGRNRVKLLVSYSLGREFSLN